MKLLLYCTKAKPYLVKKIDLSAPSKKPDFVYDLSNYKQLRKFNGKIVAECDFEVEEIKKVNYDCMLFTNTLDTEKLINKSCVGYFELEQYLKPNWNKEDNLQNLDTVGKAIHIKNLHIFDKPKELSDYCLYSKEIKGMIHFTLEDSPFILISIHPDWLCKILNGEKTIEVRKKVLKEMK